MRLIKEISTTEKCCIFTTFLSVHAHAFESVNPVRYADSTVS